MTNRMKYLATKDEIFIFPSKYTHTEFMLKLNFMKADIRGAGFFFSKDYDNKPRCVGKSDDLGIKSRPEDTDLLYTWLNFRDEQ